MDPVVTVENGQISMTIGGVTKSVSLPIQSKYASPGAVQIDPALIQTIISLVMQLLAMFGLLKGKE